MFATVIYSAAPLRRRPDHRKEMVNQLLFGESMEVLKEKGPLWLKVRSLHDDYEGWITRTLVHFTEEVPATTRSPIVATDLLNPILVGTKKMNIPFGSSLPQFENGKGRIGELEYSYEGTYRNCDLQEKNIKNILELTQPWMQAPYLWGGRTVLGVDCSGFVQLMMKMIGIDMPRDAWQQAQVGEPIMKLKEAKAGDLAFFDNKEDIVHVGILLENNQIIHSSGQVRIDQIDKRSVINMETGARMQKLRAIRRILN